MQLCKIDRQIKWQNDFFTLFPKNVTSKITIKREKPPTNGNLAIKKTLQSHSAVTLVVKNPAAGQPTSQISCLQEKVAGCKHTYKDKSKWFVHVSAEHFNWLTYDPSVHAFQYFNRSQWAELPVSSTPPYTSFRILNISVMAVRQRLILSL